MAITDAAAKAIARREKVPGRGWVTVKLKSRIPYIVTVLKTRVGAETKKGAEAVAAEARRRVPIGETRQLHDSIHVERRDEFGYKEALGEYSYAVVADAKDPKGVPYAHMVEYGTVHAAPHPFMVPAYEAVKDEIAEGIRTSIGKI